MNSFFIFNIENVSKVLIKQCELFNCDLDTAWSNYMHDLIKEQFTLSEVKYHLKNKKNLQPRKTATKRYLRIK